jgi:hypothetical protein
MNVDVVVGLLCISVILIVISVAGFKCKTDCDIEYLKSKINFLDMVNDSMDKNYNNLDKRWGDMYDIIKKQQDEIKELRRMIEPKAEKKCCCGNCRFYYELNYQSSVCLNVNVNNKLKGSSTLYAENKPITWGTIKCVEPGDICEYYEPKEVSDE